MLKKNLLWAIVAMLIAVPLAQAQPIQGSRGVPYNEGVYTADSLTSITASPAGLASGLAAYRQPSRAKVFKIAGTAGGDTSLPIPAANAILDGYLWTSKATGYGITLASGSTTVGMWLQGAYNPVPYKGKQWFDIAILDTISQVPDTTDFLVRPVKSLVGRGSFIRGVQGDTVGRGVPYWRVRLKGNQAIAADTSIHYIQLFIRYPRTQLR